MKTLLRVSRLIDAVAHRTGAFVGWLTLVMIALGVWNTLARFAARFTGLDLASNAFIEAQWYLFSLVFLLGAAHTLERGEHVRVDVFYTRLSPRARAWLDLAGILLLLVPFCVGAIVFSWSGVVQSFRVRELSPDPGGLPRFPLKAVVPLAFGLVILQGVSEALKRIRFLVGKDEESRDAG